MAPTNRERVHISDFAICIFACFPVGCRGGIFDEPEGHLTSPGYPESPPNAVSCQYIISVESGFTVLLNFSDNFQIEGIDTEQGLICPYHWLQVQYSLFRTICPKQQVNYWFKTTAF